MQPLVVGGRLRWMEYDPALRCFALCLFALGCDGMGIGMAWHEKR